jgi:5-methylcytosine-specific restriction endonuclease McrA
MHSDALFTARMQVTSPWQENDEIAHVEDTLRSESLIFGFEHTIDGCTCNGKVCSKCHKRKCCRAFVHDKRRSDGLYGHCNACRKPARDKYRQVHPEFVYVSKHNSRARKEKAAATLTTQEWVDLKAFYGYHCLCCGKQEPEIKLTADHVIPLSKGGASTIANIQPLCLSCNAKKSASSTDYRPRRNETNQATF